ncbi:MAG: hypothetical protein J0L52_05675 [Caulobacterales bacterium]|nr:hypothetical protein [Caulobacterales bacterium]
MPGSKNQEPKPPMLEVAFKRGRLTMRGEGKAIWVMPMIALIYCMGLVAMVLGMAWLASELRMLIG